MVAMRLGLRKYGVDLYIEEVRCWLLSVVEGKLGATLMEGATESPAGFTFRLWLLDTCLEFLEEEKVSCGSGWTGLFGEDMPARDTFTIDPPWALLKLEDVPELRRLLLEVLSPPNI